MTPAIREKALLATAKIACVSALFLSCNEEPKTEAEPSDVDQDGFSTEAGDCNDADANVNPAAVEICNGIDDDCSGLIDDNPSDGTQQFVDQDGDGFGAGEGELFCESRTGYVDNADDCDDTNAQLTPIDSDADGASSCAGDCNDADATMNLIDNDGDGFSTCTGDCNDENPYDMSDSDGDGQTSCEGDCADNDPYYNGLDADGDGDSTCDGDCDDTDPVFNVNDADGDGYTTCDADCDDSDPNMDACYDECTTHLTAFFQSPVDNDNYTISCCEYLLWEDGWMDFPQSELGQECCPYMQDNGHFGCTPWGPPTPPQMPRLA